MKVRRFRFFESFGSIQWFEWTSLILILAAATWLRLTYWPSNPIFSPDQARAVLAGEHILQGHWLTWGPQTSVVGVALGPLYYYWTALSLVLSRGAIWGPVLSVVVANVGAIALVWLWLRRWFGPVAAFTGASWLAVSGNAALQAQIALEPSPLPLLTVLWLMTSTHLVTAPATSKKSLWRQWGLAWFLVAMAIQLNASTIILAAVLLTIWWWRQKISAQNELKLLWIIGSVAISTLIAIKAVVKGSTSVEFWWQNFVALTFPLTFLWLTVLVLAVTAWFSRRDAHWWKTLPSDQRKILWILAVWGVWAVLAFSLKTISGEHSLNLMFVWLATIFGICLQFFLKNKLTIGLVALALCFIGQIFLVRTWLKNLEYPRLSNTQDMAEEISRTANGEPYLFLYRGHLDVYDAADDHLIYALQRSNNPPLAASRVAFDPAHPEFCDPWLPSVKAQPQVLVVYQTYPPHSSLSSQITLETLPEFWCR